MRLCGCAVVSNCCGCPGLSLPGLMAAGAGGTVTVATWTRPGGAVVGLWGWCGVQACDLHAPCWVSIEWGRCGVPSGDLRASCCHPPCSARWARATASRCSSGCRRQATQCICWTRRWGGEGPSVLGVCTASLATCVLQGVQVPFCLPSSYHMHPSLGQWAPLPLRQPVVLPPRPPCQYRMHPVIREFPSLNFYGGNLKDGPTVEQVGQRWTGRQGRGCWCRMACVWGRAVMMVACAPPLGACSGAFQPGMFEHGCLVTWWRRCLLCTPLPPLPRPPFTGHEARVARLPRLQAPGLH